MSALFVILGWTLHLYSLVILARVFMSWIPNIDPNNPIARMIYDVTEPVLRPVREMLPPSSGIDFSPMLVLLGLWVLRMVIGF